MLENSVVVNLYVVNMFLSTDNESNIGAVKKALYDRESKNPPTKCILEVLRLCFEGNNSGFSNKNFIQIYDTDQGSYMPC